MSEQQGFLTLRQAAKRMGVSRPVVQLAIDRGQITVYEDEEAGRGDTQFYVLSTDVDALIETRKHEKTERARRLDRLYQMAVKREGRIQ